MLGLNITLTEELFKKQKLFINKSTLNLFKFFILNLMMSKCGALRGLVPNA